MAKYRDGVLGPFVGKVGTVVGYLWNGKQCIRSYKREVNNPRTPAQMEHRQIFKQEVQLASKMQMAIGRTLRDMAREAGMTAHNLFVKVNQPAFGVENERLQVDYSSLLLSLGDVAQVEVKGLEWTEDNVMKVRYDRGPGYGYDHVYMYVYVPDLEDGFLSAPAYRGDKRVSLALPDRYAGHQAQVYLMVQTKEGLWSDSVYAGEVEIANGIMGNEKGEVSGEKADSEGEQRVADDVLLTSRSVLADGRRPQSGRDRRLGEVVP